PSLGPGIGFDRPSIAPGFTYESAVLGRPDQYFDPAAFVLQPAGRLGNLGRGTFIGPNFRTFDLSAMKSIRFDSPLGENTNLQIRAEAFNLFNRPNFGTPELRAFTPSFGRIRTTVQPSRQIQFGVRVEF
ncbi:MAG: TonB-dependent receptor, partial [Acidobacteria bacterium]|nr:TonB-dependent receptor [Acidobacteriota bacterium]